MLVQEYSFSDSNNGTELFRGRGLYKIDGNSVSGHWEDSANNVYSLSGSIENHVISVNWGEINNGGRSRYDFSGGKFHAVDWALRPSGWYEFMNVEYGDSVAEQ